MLRNSTNKTIRLWVRPEKIIRNRWRFLKNKSSYVECYLKDISLIYINLGGKIKNDDFDILVQITIVYGVFRIEETQLVCAILKKNSGEAYLFHIGGPKMVLK